MTAVQGTCEPAFEGVRAALADNLEQGKDVGACAAVTVDGTLVADVWGGFQDAEKTVPWEQDTIINVWSTTKTMAALSMLVLAGRGDIDVDAPVATYWPEFKAAGKENVLVRHIMSHTAGLSGWQEPMQADDLYDWELATSRLAAQEPWWEPGTASGYHAITQGYLEGEVIRRVTGQTIGSFFAQEIAGPLQADFHIGTGPEHDARVARVIPPPPLVPEGATVDPESVAMRTLTNPPLDAAQSWTEAWRRAEIPAAGGHGNALSVATVQSVLACGGEVNGRRFFPEEIADLVFREQCNGTDLVLGVPLTHGIGYGLPGEMLPLPNRRTCFWGGWGGSLIIIDLDARMTVSFVMNRMGEGTVGDDRAVGILMAAYAGLAASA
jgi:CubicO group peptidase (beta-lactamase class C family)